MDERVIKKVSENPDLMKDHRLKYLEFEGMVPNRLAKLREIVESLPEGKRRATATEIIAWFHDAFQEVLKDYAALQEGSKLRNVLADHVLTIKVDDNRRGSDNKAR